jgi:hypothetical protein
MKKVIKNTKSKHLNSKYQRLTSPANQAQKEIQMIPN